MDRRSARPVGLAEEPVEDADLPKTADAALFSFSHDVLRSPAAVDRVVDALRPGGRVAAAGAMHPWRWVAPLRPVLIRAARGYVTTTEGFERPWSHLADRLRIDWVERPPAYSGSIYIASGTAR
jgi:hypothetical protein